MTQVRVLLVDDHEIVRVGLRAVLDAEPDLRVVGEAADGTAAVRQAEALHPNVVLMDVRMGPTDGITACREIKSLLPETGVLMLTSFGADEAVIAALMAGASGFLLKNAARADLVRAVRAVAAGQSLLDPAVTRHVTRRLVELAAQVEPPELAALSAREREVLALVAQGLTNHGIAERLVISDATARNHVSHILEKLGLSRRSEAAALAARLGLLGGPGAA
ncbi:MAG: response regulator transcription factor [Dehalococcoidia bacterium]